MPCPTIGQAFRCCGALRARPLASSDAEQALPDAMTIARGSAPVARGDPMRLVILRALALLLLIALLPSVAGPQPTPAPGRERRVALVIGIGAYQNAPTLANPVSDA